MTVSYMKDLSFEGLELGPPDQKSLMLGFCNFCLRPKKFIVRSELKLPFLCLEAQGKFI